MNAGLSLLQPYPFERLRQLRSAATPPNALSELDLSIGEPRHPTPEFIHEAIKKNLHLTAKYPATRGIDALREAIAAWLSQRFSLPIASLDPARHVLPVNGTREALFAIAQCIVTAKSSRRWVAMPNPFYQIYEGAALLAGATPYFLPNISADEFTPDFEQVPEEIWPECQIVYICSPTNPSGEVIARTAFEKLITLAHRFNFVIICDECYSELYRDETSPPHGLLEVAAAMGHDSFKHCLVMHSLSKRSNAPGLRSGFVAGDADLIDAFLRYRTYHGSAMSLPIQHASVEAWSQESHVIENRALYRQKFEAVLPLLSQVFELQHPTAGFYLWPRVGRDSIDACRQLILQSNVITLPGHFLARDTGKGNPGADRLRLALVENVERCKEAAIRIRDVFKQYQDSNPH